MHLFSLSHNGSETGFVFQKTNAFFHKNNVLWENNANVITDEN